MFPPPFQVAGGPETGQHLEAGLTTKFESKVGLFAAASSLAIWRWPLATSAPPPAPHSRTRALLPPPPLAQRSLAC